MASKFTVFFIIAFGLYTVGAGPNPLVLDIGKFNLTKRGDGADQRKHKALEFVPHGHNKISTVIYGPSNIWGDSSYFLKSMELHTFCGFPQLIKLELSDDSSTKNLYFKSQDATFAEVQENDFLSYKAILNLDEYPVDYNVLFDVDKEPSQLAFYRENSTYHGFDSVDFTPKADFKVRGITSGRSLIFFSQLVITKLTIVKLNKTTRCVKTFLETPNISKVFVFISQWMLCEEDAVQQFFDNLRTKGQIITPTQTQDQPIILSASDIVPASPETQVLIPERFSHTKMVAMNLIKQPPPYPISVVQDTNLDPKEVVVNLNDIGSDFALEPLNYGDFDVTRAAPKEGCRIAQIVECGAIVWQNDRGSEILQFILYKKSGLPLLLVLSTERSGSKTEYFVRMFGKLVSVNEAEFNQFLDLWKVGDFYDKTLSFSLVDSNNFEVFDVSNKLVDGVHYFSVIPKAGFELVRIANGSDELLVESGEQWSSLTLMFFDSIHKLLSLNVVKNGKENVRNYDCKSSLVELNSTSFNNIYIENKTRIHHQADLILELNNPKPVAFVSHIEENVDLIMPLSGYQIKIVTIGNTFLWRSNTNRCTSILTISDDTIRLAKMDIKAGQSTSELYYRFMGTNALKMGGIEEFNFLKSKVTHNFKNKHQRELMTEPVSFADVDNIEFLDFDVSNVDEKVMSSTDFSGPLVITTFLCKEGMAFRKVTYFSKILWFIFENSLCARFHIYYVGTEPRFGVFEINKLGTQSKECYDYIGGHPTKLNPSLFKEHRRGALIELEKYIIEPSRDALTLNVLNFEFFKTSTDREEGMVSITYTHQNLLPFNLVSFGNEILWADENNKAKSVKIIYFDKLPVLMTLKLDSQNSEPRYLSHIGRHWHEVSEATFKSWLKRLSQFETEKQTFTIPEIGERTEFDDAFENFDQITARRFVPKDGLMSNIYDGRNLIFTNSQAYVDNVLVWYHGNTPKLFMFRERNLFGYNFDHYYVFINGWRELSFSKFEQFFNFFRGKAPLESCRTNQFVFDIARPDARAQVTQIPGPHHGFQYRVADSNTSFCCVKVDSAVVWMAPKTKQVRKFYTFGPKDAPTLAVFEEVLWGTQTDVYVQFDGKSWKEVDKKAFTDALNSLTPSTAASLSPASSPPSSPVSAPAPSIVQTPPPVSPMPTDAPTFSTPPKQHVSGFPITKPSASGAQISPRKDAPPPPFSLPSPTKVSIDVCRPVDSAKFKTASGLCDSFVPFSEFKTRAGFSLQTVWVDGVMAWQSDTDSCLAIKVFMHDGVPMILELLVTDPGRKKRFMFLTLGEAGWTFVDESAFDTALDTLVAYYKANPNS